MSAGTFSAHNTSSRIQWFRRSSIDSFSKVATSEWKPYIDVENIIIEDAFITGETNVILDDCSIDFQNKIEISNKDKRQRSIKRSICNNNDKQVRADRFIFDTINRKRPFGGLYGWIPPFIREAAKFLNIKRDQLPSQDKTKIPLIVEKAATGIRELAKLIQKECQGEKLAKMLIEKKDAGLEEVWQRCVFLYTLESFLYRKLNETMRLIGEEEYRLEWRNKVRLLGPFGLLLWDNPYATKATRKETIIYRGANLSEEFISDFKDQCCQKTKPQSSFQSFTSCSRERDVAAVYGNVLFIMTLKHAFTMNLKPFSNFPDEEEELVSPGVCFTVDRVDYDRLKNQHLIYLTLAHQFRRKLKYFLLKYFAIYKVYFFS